MNTVNSDNFNETMKGYVVKAMLELDACDDMVREVFKGLDWAIDLLTMEEARNVYDKYCNGEIDFE